MNIAYLSPLPPARSGIAHYSAMLLPALREIAEVTPVVGNESEGRELGAISIEAYQERRQTFDLAVYQLGNNPHHEFVYREALIHPGVVVLHDFVLHHLIVEMTLARGEVEAYVRALEVNHGLAGAAWARARAEGLHGEIGNFLLPASIDVARRARAVIVHNRYAAERLASFGVGSAVPRFLGSSGVEDRGTPEVIVVPHPVVLAESGGAQVRAEMRKNLGFQESDRVVGVFGFITAAKRIEVVLEAFAMARRDVPSLRLLLVGAPAPNIDLGALTQRFSLPPESWTATGYVADEDFDRYVSAADRVVNLRYPTAGETSGALLRVFAIGKPVAASDYAQFSEYPSDIVTKIPLGPEEVAGLAGFLGADSDENAIRERQRRWLAGNATLSATVEGYRRAFDAASKPQSKASRDSIHARVPLFPRLRLKSVGSALSEGRRRLTITICNDGGQPLRTAAWGEPDYRLVAKLIAEEREIYDAWMRIPRDLSRGECAELVLELAGDPLPARLELYHALQSVPFPEARPWVSVDVQ